VLNNKAKYNNIRNKLKPSRVKNTVIARIYIYIKLIIFTHELPWQKKNYYNSLYKKNSKILITMDIKNKILKNYSFKTGKNTRKTKIHTKNKNN
jgi:hypothetical protein